MSQGESLQFDSLPLIEVSLRLSLAVRCPLDFARQARLHGLVEERFPLAQASSELHQAPGRPLAFELLGAQRPPLFISLERGLLLVVQEDMLSLRWLDSVGGASAPYPRFAVMRETLDWAAARHSQVTEQSPEYDVASMSYTNFIKTPASSVGDLLARYFEPHVRPGLLHDDASFHGVDFQWGQAQRDLHVRIQRGQARMPPAMEPVDGYALMTAAGMRFELTRDAAAAFGTLHDTLQDLFISLLSPQAKTEWAFRGRS